MNHQPPTHKRVPRILRSIIATLIAAGACISATTADDFVLAPEGISSWTTRPGAICHEGVTYFAYQNQRKVEINYRDPSGRMGSPVVLHSYDYDDDHGTPSLFVVPSGEHAGRIVALFSHHNRPLYSRRSLRPRDISEWEPAVCVDAGGCNYPKPLARSDGSVWMTYRLAGVGHVYRTTRDGSAWSAATTLATNKDGLLYMFLTSKGDIFHLGFGRYDSKSKRFRDAYHAMSKDGGTAWLRSDGTAIPLPITPDGATRAYDDSGGIEWSRILDIAIHEDGTPAMLLYYNMPNFRSGSLKFLDMAVAQIRWNGSAWQMTDILKRAPYHRANMSAQGVYPCSGAQRPGDVNTVVLMEGKRGEYAGSGFGDIVAPCRAQAVLYRQTDGAWKRIGPVTDASETLEKPGSGEAFETRAQWIHGADRAFDIILSRVTHYRAYQEWRSALIGVRL